MKGGKRKKTLGGEETQRIESSTAKMEKESGTGRKSGKSIKRMICNEGERKEKKRKKRTRK